MATVLIQRLTGSGVVAPFETLLAFLCRNLYVSGLLREGLDSASAASWQPRWHLGPGEGWSCVDVSSRVEHGHGYDLPEGRELSFAAEA